VCVCVSGGGVEGVANLLPQSYMYLELEAPSSPKFLLERELYGTWATIVKNSEVKG